MRYNLYGMYGKFSLDNAPVEAWSPRGDKGFVLRGHFTCHSQKLQTGNLSAEGPPVTALVERLTREPLSVRFAWQTRSEKTLARREYSSRLPPEIVTVGEVNGGRG